MLSLLHRPEGVCSPLRLILTVFYLLHWGAWGALTANMKACGLSKFNNSWSHIHDFTKAAGNFSYLPSVSARRERNKCSSAPALDRPFP